ncbi:unnamed protein product [Arctogadus glacialis]
MVGGRCAHVSEISRASTSSVAQGNSRALLDSRIQLSKCIPELRQRLKHGDGESTVSCQAPSMLLGAQPWSLGPVPVVTPLRKSLQPAGEPGPLSASRAPPCRLLV